MNVTLDMLVDAIRSGTSTEELQRMVGPSAQEVQAATDRLSRIDALDAKCEWDSMTPSAAAQQARDRREPLIRAQGTYENQYC